MEDVAYEPYSEARLSELRAIGRPVFVNATADWCITCKFNERTTLRSERVRRYFKDNNVAYLVADWTRSDLAITTYLNRFERNGVPLYVFYPPQGEPIILPQILTPSNVIEALETATAATK
jgi:thiol:disulfide interchange protein DsbD